MQRRESAKMQLCYYKAIQFFSFSPFFPFPTFPSGFRVYLFVLLAFPALFFFGDFSVAADDARKTVIPFDFVSKFDDGRYGQMVGDLIWKRLSRDRGFIVPESMQDVRDYCESHQWQPSPEMDLKKMQKIVQDDFGGQIAIWGSVERAPGAAGDAYDLILKCVDFSAKSGPNVIYEKTARTKSVSEIPHLYVKEMFDSLAGRTPGEPPPDDPTVAANWRKNPNLVVGDFEHGVAGVPKGWDKVAGQQREPLGGLVRWTAEKGAAEGTRPTNKVIRFTLDKNVAENEGVMYYSDYFPVEEGATYRFQCRWRSEGPLPKVFVKCYDADESGRRREVYRSQQNLKGKNNVWNTQTEDFTPHHTKYAPRWGRVMLYAYLTSGIIEFDDVVVKQIVPPPKNLAPKKPRPSSASGATIEEMKEDDRRSEALKKK
jgi:hypothetical protein